MIAIHGKIWATIIHFEPSKIWATITHEWSAIISDHNEKKFCPENCILGPKFPIISSKIFQRWVTVCFFLSQEWEKIYWVRICKKIFQKNHISNGRFWWLSHDRRSFTFTDKIMSHDHSRSWSLGSKKYEPWSLMIGKWSWMIADINMHCLLDSVLC